MSQIPQTNLVKPDTLPDPLGQRPGEKPSEWSRRVMAAQETAD